MKTMCVACSITYTTVGAGLLLTNAGAPLASNVSFDNDDNASASQIEALQELPSFLASVKAPDLEEPGWLKKQKAEEVRRNQQSTTPTTRLVTYDVSSRGVVRASMPEFRTQINQTLNDSRGWSRLGVAFQEVESNGMFTLVLSTADQMTSFSSGCSADWSCRVGRYVIINQDRWLGATPAWNQAGGSLRDYRHSVVNHETGHWLGHGHATCEAPGQLAKIMQQQSIDLQGCKINPWPQDSELWSTALGIRR